jgi:hypothetical protein
VDKNLEKRILTVKTGVFRRFHALKVKIKRKKLRFLRFSFERERVRIAFPDGSV